MYNIIKYHILAILESISNWLKRIWGKNAKKKQSKLKKTIVLGLLRKSVMRHAQEGVTVVSRESICYIKALKPNNWVLVSYPSGRQAEHKYDTLFQYYVSVTDRRNNTVKIYPLSYSDYEYIHPDEDNNVWFEGFVTNKGYFKLIDEIKEERENLPIFNRTQNGQRILRELEQKKCDLVFKNGKLLIKKDGKNH